MRLFIEYLKCFDVLIGSVRVCVLGDEIELVYVGIWAR